MRKPIIAANWKMYKDKDSARKFCKEIKSILKQNDVEGIVFAPFTALDVLKDELKDTNLLIGAQNFYPQDEGAFTGEISLVMLKDFKIDYVLIGHSERRGIFNESDELINQKVLNAYKNGVKVILCCGETLEDRENNVAVKHCLGQIESALAGLSESEVAEIVIAYEPIWAIGTGKTASSSDAQEMLGEIRVFLSEKYNQTLADKVRLLYGGSVKPDNIKNLMQERDIDGALVGGASLKADSFNALLNYEER